MGGARRCRPGASDRRRRGTMPGDVSSVQVTRPCLLILRGTVSGTAPPRSTRPSSGPIGGHCEDLLPGRSDNCAESGSSDRGLVDAGAVRVHGDCRWIVPAARRCLRNLAGGGHASVQVNALFLGQLAGREPPPVGFTCGGSARWVVGWTSTSVGYGRWAMMVRRRPGCNSGAQCLFGRVHGLGVWGVEQYVVEPAV